MTTATAADAARRAAEEVARRSYGKLVALLAARTRDVSAAEDALSDAFASALVDWPQKGVPQAPEAWILTVARRRLIDSSRRQRSAADATEHLQLLRDELEAAASADHELPDRRLALMFACAHPALDSGIRAPLILQTTLGFDAAVIASAFLVSPSTMSQRLVRAKRKIRDAGIPFEVPTGADLAPRLDAVLDALYAAFCEGWSDPSGTDLQRRNLAGEALWLGRLVVARMPEEPEALGLLALMLHAQARRGARRDGAGEYVPLAEQNPADWDAASIQEAEALLRCASALPGIGRFQLEAAVQSAHVARRHRGQSDWNAIDLLYGALFELTRSPVVAVNRSIAVANLRGAAAGLELLDAISGDRSLSTYQPFWAARADLLARTGARAEADAAYERAIGLERDPAVRRHLSRRREQLSES